MTTTYRTAMRDAELRARAAGVPTELLVPVVELQIRERPIVFEYATDMPVTERLWEVTIVRSDTDAEVSQFRMRVNVGHPWIMFMLNECSRGQVAQVEIFLMVLAGTDKRDEKGRKFLDAEMQQWERRLAKGGEVLEGIYYPEGRPETADA